MKTEMFEWTSIYSTEYQGVYVLCLMESNTHFKYNTNTGIR